MYDRGMRTTRAGARIRYSCVRSDGGTGEQGGGMERDGNTVPLMGI